MLLSRSTEIDKPITNRIEFIAGKMFHLPSTLNDRKNELKNV
jgi:hypothetical protein